MQLTLTRKQTKLTVVLLSVILICSIGGLVYGQAGSVSVNVYLNDLPSGPTYTLKTDGATYWAVKYDGSTLSDTDVSDLFLAAKNDCDDTGGWIHFAAGTFVLNSPLLLAGVSGDGFTLTGSGLRATVFSVSQAVEAALIINNSAYVSVSDFKIEMNYYGGHGVYTNQVDGSSLISSYLARIDVEETANGYYAFYLKNPSYIETDSLRAGGYGSGLMLENDYSGQNRGNSYIQNTFVQLEESNTVGVYFKSVDGYMNLNTLINTEIYGINGGSKTERYGMIFDDSQYNVIIDTTIEELETADFYFNGSDTHLSKNNIFYGGYCDARGDFIVCDDYDFRSNVFHDFQVWLRDAGAEIIKEAACNYEGNSYYNVVGYGSSHADPYITLDDESHVFDTTGFRDTTYSENVIVLSSVANGTYVAHGLFMIPGNVQISCSSGDYGYFGGRNSTHVQVCWGSGGSKSGLLFVEAQP